MTSNKYVIVKDESALNAALALSRGCYQTAILTGYEALSGATLRGKAKKFAGRYKRSAQSIIDRVSTAGIAIKEVIGDHNRRMLVIG